MDCKYCKTQMDIGEAIKPSTDFGSVGIVPSPTIKFEELEVIPVMKCPVCGHSEYIY